ncbi:hypothetical protein GCM10009549_17910 [Streptomyces thermoalcalitolerans]|uniref:Uncharacterized protein n=1 Tax=Streptomyces thermoalcalitolerans TaxID=65605 RepID=A0ABN1NIV1_9ACTN
MSSGPIDVEAEHDGPEEAVVDGTAVDLRHEAVVGCPVHVPADASAHVRGPVVVPGGAEASPARCRAGPARVCRTAPVALSSPSRHMDGPPDGTEGNHHARTPP